MRAHPGVPFLSCKPLPPRALGGVVLLDHSSLYSKSGAVQCSAPDVLQYVYIQGDHHKSNQPVSTIRRFRCLICLATPLTLRGVKT